MKNMLLLCSVFLSLNLLADNLDDWRKMINEKKAIGLDLRTFAETKLNSAKGAKHLSYFDLNQKNIEKLKIDKNKTVLLFCESGGRASKSIDTFKKAGYSNVINIKDWRTWNKISPNNSKSE